MSKNTSPRADFNWLPDGIEIPVALWKAPKAFIAAKDVRYYLNGIHFAPCAQVWATNGHIGITIDLPHAFADKPVPSWFPGKGVTFYPPKLPSGTYTTRAYPTDEKASVSSDGKISTGGDPVWRLECYDDHNTLLSAMNLYTIGGVFPDMPRVVPENFDSIMFDTETQRDGEGDCASTFVPATGINTAYLATLDTILPSSKKNFTGAKIKCTGTKLHAHLVGEDNWARNINVVIMGLRV